MRRALAFRPLVVVLVVGLLVVGVVGVSGSALATTGTGTQNPDLTVTASLTNESGGEDGNPDTATAGESVTQSGSVTNNSSRGQPQVEMTLTLTDPSGDSMTKKRRTVLQPGETFSVSHTSQVTPSDEKGTYTLTVEATNRNATSSATAQLTVY